MAGSVKTFRNVGEGEKTHRWPVSECNLREKRRDPWHRANAPLKAAADPALSGQDADRKSQTCLDLVRRPVAQSSAKAS